MAFLIKSARQPASGPNSPGAAVIQQHIHVSRAAKALPQTTTEQLFQVRGGRVLVHLLIGEVTTVIQGTDPVAKVTAGRLNAAMDTLVGTVYDIASTLDMSSDEVGSIYTIEGDGTAIVSPQLAGAGYGTGRGPWIMPNGEIYLTTGASKTGALKWDIWYQPLDEGSYVVAMNVATAAI